MTIIYYCRDGLKEHTVVSREDKQIPLQTCIDRLDIRQQDHRDNMPEFSPDDRPDLAPCRDPQHIVVEVLPEESDAENFEPGFHIAHEDFDTAREIINEILEAKK